MGLVWVITALAVALEDEDEAALRADAAIVDINLDFKPVTHVKLPNALLEDFCDDCIDVKALNLALVVWHNERVKMLREFRIGLRPRHDSLCKVRGII